MKTGFLIDLFSIAGQAFGNLRGRLIQSFLDALVENGGNLRNLRQLIQKSEHLF
jgi:hypothetical protein